MTGQGDFVTLKSELELYTTHTEEKAEMKEYQDPYRRRYAVAATFWTAMAMLSYPVPVLLVIQVFARLEIIAIVVISALFIFLALVFSSAAIIEKMRAIETNNRILTPAEPIDWEKYFYAAKFEAFLKSSLGVILVWALPRLGRKLAPPSGEIQD